MKSMILTTLALLTAATSVSADTIIIGGRQYDDVLIYESDSFYFVKIPTAGDIISVAKTDVLGKPLINNDYFYRREKRALYNDVRDGKQPASGGEGSVFQVEDSPAAESVDTSGLLSSGGGSGKAMNLTVDEAKGAFTAMQVNFSGSGDEISGTTPDGVISVTLKSKGNKVVSISGQASGDPNVVQQKAMGLVGVMNRVAPWAAGWVLQNQAALGAGGSIQKTQDGVSISVTVGAGGLNFSITGA